MIASRYFVDLYEGSADPDFATYAESGHVLVAHKATQGDYHIDAKVAERVRQAHAQGLTVKFYHFCDWQLGGSPRREAEMFWRVVKPLFQKGDKLALDYERARAPESPPSLDYIQTVHAAVLAQSGHDAEIYGSTAWLEAYCRRGWLRRHKRWEAAWGPNPGRGPWRRRWWAWQYTDGRVGGFPRALAGCPSGDVSMLRLDVALRLQVATFGRRRRARRHRRQGC